MLMLPCCPVLINFKHIIQNALFTKVSVTKFELSEIVSTVSLFNQTISQSFFFLNILTFTYYVSVAYNEMRLDRK